MRRRVPVRKQTLTEGDGFQLTLGDIRQIINEELQRLEERAVNDDNVVKAVQAAMNMLEYSVLVLGKPLSVDGIYGKNTSKVVRAFQRDRMGEKEVDGKVGPKTAKAIQAALASEQPAKSGLIGDGGEGDEQFVDMSTGRKPISRMPRSPKEYVESKEIADKISAAANDSSLFSTPYTAGHVLQLAAEEDDRELLSLLRDMAIRGGRRTSVRAKQKMEEYKGIVRRTRKENRKAMAQKLKDRIRAASKKISQYLDMPVFDPDPEQISEQLDPSGDEAYTADVVNTLMDKIQDQRMVLSPRRKKTAATGGGIKGDDADDYEPDPLHPDFPVGDDDQVGAPGEGDEVARKRKAPRIPRSKITSVAKFLSSKAFGQFTYPSFKSVDPEAMSPWAKQKAPEVWEKASKEITSIKKAGQMSDLVTAYKEVEGDELLDDISHWKDEATKRSKDDNLKLHIDIMTKIHNDVRNAIKEEEKEA